jgi:hypothetical protein
MARERGAHATGDRASTFIASDSEATQTNPQLETSGLGRVALLAMTESAVDSVAEGPGRPPIRES